MTPKDYARHLIYQFWNDQTLNLKFGQAKICALTTLTELIKNAPAIEQDYLNAVNREINNLN
jgi:hypothetical protein